MSPSTRSASALTGSVSASRLLLVLVLGAALLASMAQATCTTGNQVCRCKSGSVEVGSFDADGCYTCFCQARPAPTTAAATTVAATTRAATTAAATTAATTRAATTTAGPATTTRAPTTLRVATTLASQCGPLPNCGCSEDVTITWATDNRGCPTTCSCGPAPSTTARPATTTARPVTQASTAAAPTAAAETTRAITTKAPFTLAPTASTAASSCAPLAFRDNCNCGPNTVKYYRTDAWGCLVCGCKAVPDAATTTVAATTVATTTRATTRATTAAPVASTTTAARVTTRAETAAPATTVASNGMCGTPSPCRCKSGATAAWMSDSIGCPVCYCQAARGASAVASEEASSSGSAAASSSGSSSGVPTYVPVVVALVALVAVVAGVIGVQRYKTAHGRFPWAGKDSHLETSV